MFCAAAPADTICSISGILGLSRITAITITITGARSALLRSASNISVPASGLRDFSAVGEQFAKTMPGLAAHNEKFPGTQPTMIGRAKAGGEDLLDHQWIGLVGGQARR